jgi:hypothetical protein
MDLCGNIQLSNENLSLPPVLGQYYSADFKVRRNRTGSDTAQRLVVLWPARGETKFSFQTPQSLQEAFQMVKVVSYGIELFCPIWPWVFVSSDCHERQEPKSPLNTKTSGFLS